MFRNRHGLARIIAVFILTGLSLGTASADEASSTSQGNKALMANGFSWFANAAPGPSDRQLQAQLIRMAVAHTDGNSIWVCSPAGFGKPSTCSRS